MKVVAVQFEVQEPVTIVYEPGEKYTYFKNGDTYYQLKAGCEVDISEDCLEEAVESEIIGTEIVECCDSECCE
jgi:hypothetical protein